MLLIKTKEESSVKGKRKGCSSTKKWKEERCLRCSIERTYEQLEAMKTVDGASLCSFWDDLDKTTDSFKGFNLEKRVEGKEMFELDRAELLSSTLVYLNARFNPLLQNPVLMWMEGSVEHRRWPAADHPTPGALMDWGNEDLRSLAKHFSGLEAMQHFDVNEAIFEYNRAKIELPGEPFFILSYRQFWEHVSAHYNNVNGYPVSHSRSIHATYSPGFFALRAWVFGVQPDSHKRTAELKTRYCTFIVCRSTLRARARC